ncbi:MAG: hypothetical protein NTU44_06305 [Bacteroidetes bacterium]|nr:hypothetical protein [Bacteroidota bacterium]
MRRLECQNCKKVYVHNHGGLASCPNCGSNSYNELPEHENHEWWKDLWVLICFLVLVMMIIGLFLLPRLSNEFIVKIDPRPQESKILLLVNNGDEIADPAGFSYSLDDGRDFQPSNIFNNLKAGKYTIKVKHNKNNKAKFTYSFSNPVSFTPEIIIPPNPCDCKNLKVVKVESVSKDGKNGVQITSSQPACRVLYSVSDKTGKYQEDNFFPFTKKTKLNIFIKHDNCDPVAFKDNPYNYSPPAPAEKPVLAKPQPQAPAQPQVKTKDPTYEELSAQIEKIINNGAVPSTINPFIQKYFAGKSVNVLTTKDNMNYPISEYLSNHDPGEKFKIKVTNAAYNTQHKVTSISINENKR